MVAQVKTWHDATRSELIVTVLSAVDLEPRVGGQYRSARWNFHIYWKNSRPCGILGQIINFWANLGCVSWDMSGGLVGPMSKVFKCQISNLNRLLGLVSTGIKTKRASSHLNETVERCCWCFLQESLRQALPSARPKVLNVQFFFPLISLLFLHSMQ